jgi:hypothetical protein
LLVRVIAENFAYNPTGGRSAGGPAGGSTFALIEFFDGDDPTTVNWRATLTKTADPTGLCPAPIIVIDQTPVGQAASGATLYRGLPVQDPHHPDVYNITSFVNDPEQGPAQTLIASDALGNPLRSLQIQPLDIVDWHNGRYYLQIVRNQTMPLAFQYVTALIAAKDRVLPLIDNAHADVDLATLPPAPFKQEDHDRPVVGSFGDMLTRLFYALLNGKRQNPDKPAGGMRTEIALSYPLPPGATGAAALPDVRLPVVLQLLAAGFTFYPSAADAWAMAKPIATKVATWMTDNGVAQRPDLTKSAHLDVSVTVFSATSETSLPMIYLDGLFVNLRDLT